MSAQPSTPNPIWGVLRLVVVVAAAAGGWFAYDEYIAEDASAVAAEQVADPSQIAPWPADVVVDETPPTGNTRMVFENADGIVQLQKDTNASTGQVRMLVFDENGSEMLAVETNGIETWLKYVSGEQGWVNAASVPDEDVEEITSDLLDIAYVVQAVSLNDIVPPEVWSHTRLLGDEIDVDGTRALSIRFKGASFAAEQPAQAAQWRLNNLYHDGVGPFDMTIRLSPDGRVLSVGSMTGATSETFRFAEVPEDPIFESPLGN